MTLADKLREVADELLKCDCDGLNDGTTFCDREGNRSNCDETDETIDNWCVRCLGSRYAELLSQQRDELAVRLEKLEARDMQAIQGQNEYIRELKQQRDELAARLEAKGWTKVIELQKRRDELAAALRRKIMCCDACPIPDDYISKNARRCNECEEDVALLKRVEEGT